MDKELKEKIDFLKEQLEWSKKQSILLEQIEQHLVKMREIAEVALDLRLSIDTSNELNDQFAELQAVVTDLQKQANPVTIH
ncbi:hypothetical protein [Bacillus sp. FJAT-45037]|uniref:hypothetical protein n=1 Tax=Bacillus sp. FJAT-45037 TaxID=2011007 RepID=UPI000C24AA77|nr:hypothetical protein [Bacillus sp. FJAT-45037]